MRFAIHHQTRFAYSQPVFLEPHRLRFTPRTDGMQRVLRSQVTITPEPDGLSFQESAEGNLEHRAWFSGLTEALQITATAEVETRRENAFDYLIESRASLLPLRLDEDDGWPLRAYIERRDAQDESVCALARDVAREVGGRTMEFLARLTQRLYRELAVTVREEGPAWEAAETLRRGEGACRDLTVLFMEACRAQGLPARFVSGYQEGTPDQEERHLHAWPEVYVPGGGWRGYDPTHGLAVSDRHVAVAVGHGPEAAAPSVGTFRGTGAVAQLTHEIDLQVL